MTQPTTARLDLSIWRNDDLYEFPIRVIGPNLTGVGMRAQIRTGDDSPFLLVGLDLVDNGNAEGVRLVSATKVDGLWVNDVRIRLNKSTRQGLPYGAQRGSDWAGKWVFAIAGKTRITGEVRVLAHALDSDAAPLARTSGFDSYFTNASAALPDAGATLTIAADSVAELVIDGADLVERAASLSQDSADRSQANAVATGVDAGRAALFASTALGAIGGLMYSTVAAGAAANPDGKPFSVMGDGTNTYAILYSVKTTVFDFRNGAMPAGTSLKRAAGANSRIKRVEYTDYDFTSGVLPAGVTVQRAAGPWSRRAQTGSLELGTSANTPRFDYDPPVNGALAICRGLMLEPSRTNYFLTSDTLTGRASSGTISYSAGRTSPTGAQAARIAFGDNAVIAPLANTAITAGQAWTASIYSVADAATTINFGTNGLTAAGNNKGVVAAVDVAWSRLTYTNTPAVADTGMYISFGTGGVGTGTGGPLTARTVEASGIQMELGATVSSYIPTTTTAATRPVELLIVPSLGKIAGEGYFVTYTFADGSTFLDYTKASADGITTLYPSASTAGKAIARIRLQTVPSGVMEFGAAVDTARFDYDPATGASRGVLVEPATTNGFLQSAINNTNWTRESANLIPDALNGLAGSPNLTRMEVSQAIGGGAAARVYNQGGDTDPSKTYTRDIYCKLGTPAFKYLWITRDGGPQLCFNMETGVVVSASASITATVTALPNGVFRLFLVTAGINAGGNNTFLWLSDRTTAPSVSGNTSVGTFCYVGGAMSEQRAGATSYVPTTTAAATRSLETLVLQSASGTYRMTYSDGSTQDLALTAVDGVVSIPATSLTRYNVATVTALVPVEASRYVGKPVVDQAVTSASRIGVFPEAFGAIGDGVADDWAALQASANTGLNIFFLPGRAYRLTKPVQLKPGQIVTGYAPGRFGSTARTLIFNDQLDGGCFWYTLDTSTADMKMPRISNLSLRADYPVRFNDERTAILKDGAASNVPPGKKPGVTNCDIDARVAAVGIGISWSKMFDGDVTGTDITGFDISILLNGCDLCRVEHNRLQAANSYHVLELSGGSFGSQTTIAHNDILQINANGIFIKSTARHARISDNYLEQGGACKGFIDCSAVAVPTYAGNVGNERFTTVVRDNRIDGKANATQFVYRYQPDGQTYGEIIDVGSTGVAANAPVLLLVNGAGVRVDCVPFIYNQTNKATFVFQGPGFGIWNGYRTIETPDLRITGRNAAQFAAPALFADDAGKYLRGRGESIVLLPGGDPTFSFLYPASTRLFAAGYSCIAEFVARVPSGNENLSIGAFNGSGGALTIVALTTEFRRVLVRFTAGAGSNGLYLKRSQGGGEIEIRSLRVYPLYAQEIPRTTVSPVILDLDQIEGQIEVYAEGAGGGAPAAYLYGFAGERLIELGRTVTNADALAVVATQSADLSRITFELTGSGGGKGMTVRRKALSA